MSHFFHSQNVLDFSFLTSTIVDQVCKPWENFWNIRQVNFENSTPSKKKKIPTLIGCILIYMAQQPIWTVIHAYDNSE